VRAKSGEVCAELADYVEPDLEPLAWGYQDKAGPYRKAIVCPLIGKMIEADRTLVLHLLDREVAAARRKGSTKNARLLFSYLLSRLGELEDVLAIWRAKNSPRDGFFAGDVQVLVGSGIEEALEYLEGIGTDEALEAASYLIEC
jgi:hypothetical protein